jgi:hypothetical protein
VFFHRDGDAVQWPGRLALPQRALEFGGLATGTIHINGTERVHDWVERFDASDKVLDDFCRRELTLDDQLTDVPAG